MENKFKIITPSYNNEEWVEYNLASVLNQTYTNYEVLYINDNSTDNTFNKVKETEIAGRKVYYNNYL
jgi:glycosyltransferase involved in cell wall biosynthesis